MLQALLDNHTLLLFLAMLIPLVFFGFVGMFYQAREEKLYDERMRLLRGRAWRDTYYLLIALGLLLMCCSAFFNLMGRTFPVDASVLLAFVFCCGLSFFISDCIVRGVFVGRKETPALYMSQALIFTSASILYIALTVSFGEELFIIPLTFRTEVFYLLMIVYTTSYASACWARYVQLRKELTETEESNRGEKTDE